MALAPEILCFGLEPMKAVWQARLEAIEKLCPFGFTTFQRSSAWRTKQVLAKAKELGIAAARVASSSLDKITAEYLEEQTPQGASRARRSAAAPPPAAPAAAAAQANRSSSSPPPPAQTTGREPTPPRSHGPGRSRCAAAEAPRLRRPPRPSPAAASQSNRHAAAEPPTATAASTAAARPQGGRQSRVHSIAAQARRAEPPTKPGSVKPPPPRPAEPRRTEFIRRGDIRGVRGGTAPRRARRCPAPDSRASRRPARQSRRTAGAAPKVVAAGRRPGHHHQAADRRARTGRAAQAEAVQDHRRPDGAGRLRQRQPGH